MMVDPHVHEVDRVIGDKTLSNCSYTELRLGLETKLSTQ